MIVPAAHVLAFSILLFAVGVVGVVLRRNIVAMLLGIELMFSAATLVLVAFDGQRVDPGEGALALIVTLIAVAEVAVALAVVGTWLRARGNLDVDEARSLRW